MKKLALTMIVAGHEKPEDLKRCLHSVNGHVDAIFVTITSPKKGKKLEKIVEEYGGEVDYLPRKFWAKITQEQYDWYKEKMGYDPHMKVGDKIFQFDEARNHSLDKAKDFEYMLWLDADDVLRHGDRLKEITKKMDDHKVDAAFLNYIYQAEFDKDWNIKNILIEHLRERIVRPEVYEWVAPIHETLIEKRPSKKVDFDECDVVHLSTFKRMEKALYRNVKALEFGIWKTQAKDPRPIYYLAKAFFDIWLQKHDESYVPLAKKLFEEYLSGEAKSGWAAERAQCWDYLAEIHRHKGEYNNAIKCNHNSMIEDGTSPATYINLAVTYLLMKQWDKALFWVKVASRMDMPKNTLVTNPRDMQARALEVVYHVSLNTNKLDEAWASAQKLEELYPENEEMKGRVELTSNMRRQRELTKHVYSLAKYLDQTEKNKLQPLMLSVPHEIENNPFMADLRNRIIPPRVWEDNEVAIYCGPGATPWSPRNLEDGKAFIGGSEEAVIYLTKELVKQGWKVTVYSDPGADEGEHDGVNYVPYFKFNGKDKFNILVVWRRPGLLDWDLDAKKIYIWAHDILNNLDFTPERIKKLHKVMVLSEWHRQNIPSVPDEKILITGNGINV